MRAYVNGHHLGLVDSVDVDDLKGCLVAEVCNLGGLEERRPLVQLAYAQGITTPGVGPASVQFVPGEEVDVRNGSSASAEELVGVWHDVLRWLAALVGTAAQNQKRRAAVQTNAIQVGSSNNRETAQSSWAAGSSGNTPVK
jgi:hypothetical protein